MDNTDIWSLAVNPETPATIFAGTGDGIYRGEDEGDNWTRIGSDIIGSEVSALAIDPQSPSTIYAGAGDLFKSIDGGNNWVSKGLDCIMTNALAINPSVPSTIYAGIWCTNVLFKSVDGGDNWTPTGLFAVPVLVFSINPLDPSIIYAGTMSDLFTSTEGGDSWVRTECGITHVWTIAINPEFPDTIYTGGGVGYVHRSIDGGKTWEDITNGIITEYVYALAINPDFPDTIYAGTEDGIYRSADGGDTWEDITNGIHPNVRAIAINPDAPNKIYAGTSGGVFRSANGGDNWIEINEGLSNLNVNALAINPKYPESSTIYAGIWGGVFAADFMDVPDYPVPDIKANNSDGPITIETNEVLSVAISLSANDYAGQKADWWVVADTPSGMQSYVLDQGFVSGLSVTYQGAVFDLGFATILNTSGLTDGAYTYYFGIDLVQNGELDMTEGLFYYDSVEVTVQ